MRAHQIQEVRSLYRKYEKHNDILPGLYKHSLEVLEKKPSKYLHRWIQLIEPVSEYVRTQDHRRPGVDIRKFLPMMEKPPEQTSNRAQGLMQQIDSTEGVTSTQKSR